MNVSSQTIRASAALLIAAAAFTASGPARAQLAPAPAQGFAIDRFDPSERGSEWFVMDTLDFRGGVRPAIGVVGDWAHKPLVAYDADGNETATIVSDQFFVHVGGSLVLADSLRIAMSWPFALYETGSDGASGGTTLAAPTRASTGDLRFSADLRLLGTYGSPFNLAIGAALYVPTGEPKEYSGDGFARGMPRVLVAGESGSFAYAAKLGWMIRGRSADFAGVPQGDNLVFGASAGVRLADHKLLLGPEIYGSTGVTSSDAFFGKYTTPLEVLLGGHYTAGGAWRVGAGFGPGLLVKGEGTPAWRGVLSLEWTPEPAAKAVARVGDRDGDSVPDDRDMCPDRPGVATPAEPLRNGCPPDRDRDGVADVDDACPDVPGVRTDDPKTNGCPPDRDKDGVPDAEDACPDVPGVKTSDPKTNGCPPDRDKDGVADPDDACPDVPGVKTSDPKTNGCPPPDPDRDKDGIPNEQDACPDTPGEKTEDPKTNGCPKAFVQGAEIKINEQVKFKFNSAEILKDSDAVLSAVAKILVDHPEIARVRIEGHTDNVGKPAYNKGLSQRRAASVVAWLVGHGIDKGRLYPEGFGAERPLDNNTTEEGRKNNRRVEFHIEGQK
jgi:outer membrane protein OmpA-like peptidoglycan-associated protein